MKKNVTLLLLFLTIGICSAQQVEVIKYDQLKSLMHAPNGKVKVINFWATWCAPCIKEMPQFVALQEKAGAELEIILISLDFAEKVDKVSHFVERKGLKSKVYLLDETDYNTWIDKVDKNWSGAIPATIFVGKSGKNQLLHEGEFEENGLNVALNNFIKTIN